MKPARYRVCTPRRQYFATLPEAIAAANAHFRRTGNVVAIESTKR